ncbi:MAG: hypothetical protein H6858_04740 [Rhodospirillales bacterium]|nr:hypothetical protein [Alphaproteobacteria bacterium]MCB9976892.1 hypothetical protein [Rhodospirillales bacterium]
MMYITVDGMLSGTGLRDSKNGGYIDPDELGISDFLKSKLSAWLGQYANCHYMQYKDESQIELLDKEGMEICKMLKQEMPNLEIDYYSNAKLKRLPIN